MTVIDTQYEDAGRKLIDRGVWVENTRTGHRCKTLVGETFEWDLSDGRHPVVTTRPVPIKLPVAELIGYLRGYTNADDFARIGAKSWYTNANETAAWLANPNRKGENDTGLVYGGVSRNWPMVNGNQITTIDTVKDVFERLERCEDDRGLIVTHWNPGMFHLGALRPCMHTYNFAILGDQVHGEFYSRSMDMPLGGPANLMQASILTHLAARLAGLRPGRARLHVTNLHVYENQYDKFCWQMERDPLPMPKMALSDRIQTFNDIENVMTAGDVLLSEFDHRETYEQIWYPLAA
ncbi:MAG: thymidylate synthase [Natronospirillum sp.]|uniref:thymidylate synthase n=1 Tax=Natronospirillum sp. TaxID=2812955 RepID=UPI0025F44FCF|nr:thymidylate synthase [Natronospirillum sp.]MCH8552928.1 thymidylate synthase [Natronospirillum sp.]